MKKILMTLAMLVPAGFVFAEQPPPTHANVAYGSHPRNVLDLWLAPSDKPTPLLINIHGGGFRGGDKSKLSASLIEMMHKEVISVASINYRFKERGKGRFDGEDHREFLDQIAILVLVHPGRHHAVGTRNKNQGSQRA